MLTRGRRSVTMSDHREYDRRDRRSSSQDRGSYRGVERGQDAVGERSYRRSPPRCFACNERGHYANQCKNRWRAREDRPSTSYETRRGRSISPRGDTRESTVKEVDKLQLQIKELNKSLASVSEFVQSERAKKEAEEQARREAEAEEQRKVAEKKAKEKKERRRLEKLQREQERDAELEKKMEMQLAMKTGDFFGPVLNVVRKAKAKKQVVTISDHDSESEHGSHGSDTEGIRTQTRRLTINEKRKRGPEPAFEDSPPMLTPAKRTPRGAKEKGAAAAGRVARSKAKLKTKLSPYLARMKKTPGQPGTVAKLRYRNQAMEELRNLDAQELQAICKEEGIAYNGKVDAIFDIARRLQRVNRMIEKRGCATEVESASFDIKEMFSRLPHEDIRDAVHWIVKYYQEKGLEFVRVNTRGRGASFGKTTGADHWRRLELGDVVKLVDLELGHTYTNATGVLLRQVVDIPMGKSTSPPLACILCAMAESKFINSLGRYRRQVFGIRLIDDVILVTTSLPAHIREEILCRFDVCYPRNLILKRTDSGSGVLQFLGCEIRTNQTFPYLGCVQLVKNEDTIWEEEKLVFQNGQSFSSWGSKQLKNAIIYRHLHRIDRNTTI
ncbi:hypothetical protein CBR_g52034 [Chara braunii]|uniref:CCHC-type domain-containing protein n=1 Tax=Chara braunii TaxID=69332 RepID=A0A388M9J2_CHABU|nr:hypothetical protein CBR_g52034 [Chara braunii]|eukprot:GBG91153.1 hypothetical protein CBR_g52034 [Chara braunii]